MMVESSPWDPAEHLRDADAIAAYFEGVFDDGDPQLVAAALNDVARAKGVGGETLSGDTSLGGVIRTLKALGLQITAQPA